MKSIRHGKDNVGFTLKELLVVIAIIDIFAKILFPVFATARDKARQSSCESNMKQMGLALIQYDGDNDETFPFNYTTNPTGPAATSFELPGWISNALVAYVKAPNIYQCPSRQKGGFDDPHNNNLPVSYEYNYEALYYLTPDAAAIPVQMSTIGSP